MTNTVVIDNAVNTETFKAIQADMLHDRFDWYYRDTISRPGDGMSQFIHPFFINSLVETSKEKFSMLFPILNVLSPTSIIRIKANSTHKTPDTIETPLHIDVMSPGSLTAIFYMNTNNGYTYFEDGTKVESVENRLVVFPSYFSHAGATCTDEQRRVVININYATDTENSIWKKLKTKHDIEYENEWTRLCGDY